MKSLKRPGKIVSSATIGERNLLSISFSYSLSLSLSLSLSHTHTHPHFFLKDFRLEKNSEMNERPSVVCCDHLSFREKGKEMERERVCVYMCVRVCEGACERE